MKKLPRFEQPSGVLVLSISVHAGNVIVMDTVEATDWHIDTNGNLVVYQLEQKMCVYASGVWRRVNIHQKAGV
jgi:hypothetical protein